MIKTINSCVSNNTIGDKMESLVGYSTPLGFWKDENALAILIRLCENNPLQINDLRQAVDISDDKILELVKRMSVFSLIKTDDKLRQFEITEQGKLYLRDIGITKAFILEEKRKAG